MTLLYSRLLKSLIPITLVAFSLLPLFAHDKEAMVENNVTTDIIEKMPKVVASNNNDTDAMVKQQVMSLADPSGFLRGASAPKVSKVSTNDKEQEEESSHV